MGSAEGRLSGGVVVEGIVKDAGLSLKETVRVWLCMWHMVAVQLLGLMVVRI
jgi:hypothetical protein